MTRPTIVSIQSQLVFGCAGNNAAVPLLQGLGARVFAVPTTLLSNTPHYPTLAGGPIDPALIEDLLARLLDRVAATEIDAVLTGYIASPGAATAAARFIDRVRKEHPSATVLCDPVMGDMNHGLYVEEEAAGAIAAELVPRADMLTPNLFEARRLTGLALEEPWTVLDTLLAHRASIVAITGIDADSERIMTVASDGANQWTVSTPRLDVRPTGTGDVFSAAFLHTYLRTKRPDDALEKAVEIVFGLLKNCEATATAVELDPNFATPLDNGRVTTCARPA